MFYKSFNDFGVNFSHINPPYVTPWKLDPLLAQEEEVEGSDRGHRKVAKTFSLELFGGPLGYG